LDILNRLKDELETKLRQNEQKLADALNAQDEFGRLKRDMESRIDDLIGKNQKLKDELEDARNEAEKVIKISIQNNCLFSALSRT
jgi:DNA repair ATPase RecN